MTTVPRQVTPVRLTALLRRAGILTDDEVVDVAVEASRDLDGWAFRTIARYRRITT
jgi:hypothetical protein